MKSKYLTIVLLFNTLMPVAQTINISKIISINDVVANLSTYNLQGKTVLASGRAKFTTNKGFVRILLTDDHGYDLLIYESIPLISPNNVDIFSDITTEASNIPANLKNCKVRVEIENARLDNLVIKILANNHTNIQRIVATDRISKINSVLRDKKALWVAGETSISKMSYEEKKALFGGKVPDLQGAEYYMGGIFELNNKNYQAPTSSEFVDNFDWRNRHGKNWLTSVKNQGNCGSCWAFGALGAVEALVNLYYNRQINLDLSEEQMKACTNGSCNGGAKGGVDALEYIKRVGVVSESCLPYTTTDIHVCSDVCNNPDEQIKIFNYSTFNPYSFVNPIDELKKIVIKHGVLSGRIEDWHHTIALVGFGTIKAGDKIKLGAGNFITVPTNDPRIGQTYWIFKNSWGSLWGDNGYCFILAEISQLHSTRIPKTPIISKNYKESDIVCEDRDGDGYYWWGIGEKPKTCPNCPDEPDGDDSNPILGPMDEYGHCKILNNSDLYVRDSVADIGNEPSGVSRMWVSPDIWIEDMDGNKVDPHGNDVYNVCVRVHNKSDYPSSGREVLLLNWTKGGLDLDWNGCWFGMKFFDCDGWKVPRGSYVNDARGTAIPIIQPHRSEVVRVKWLVPRREDYKGCDTTLDKELWHFCLLARIHDGHPIYLEDDSPANLAEMIVRNNNVALRNITVLESKHNRSIVSVGNPFKELRSFSLLYTLFKNEKGELLNKYADVYLNMSSNLFELFEKSGFEGKGFKVVDKNKILLTEPTATIERLVLQPEELYLLEAEVNFFTQEEPENNEFMFDIAEYVDNEKGGKELIGGETYIAIRNSERDSYFKAKAVDNKTVLPAEPVSFRAEPISEDAVYTWFDQKGDTVARGLNLTVTPTSTQHYKLEVVATADGFKDYDSVRATVRNGAIVSLSPNPTDNQLTITYRLAAGITNATIEISDVQNLSVQSYPVTATATTKTVSLAGLTAGTYMVKLIVDGVTVDTRQVIKN